MTNAGVWCIAVAAWAPCAPASGPETLPDWARGAAFSWKRGGANDDPPADTPRTWRDGWKGAVEGGLNGSSGNSETFNIRVGAAIERTGTIWESKDGVIYTRDSSGGEVTKNRFEAFTRNDFRFQPDSRWRYFTQARYEYDDFQDWQHRVSAGAGLGYAFVETDRTTVVGRAGLGVTGELGGTEGDDWTPEGIIGADFEHRFTQTQRLFANVDVLPALDGSSNFRVVARGGYEVVVDPANQISLKLGGEDRYDSNPGPGRKRNDVDYFVLLAWKF